ncbi:hypothetical protein, conserved [Eimeria tenella]|uniref:Uncharacterized protein n=1 Tax=Eimeria tenella TaxID=5802 RepID=U6L353_EIMTE|nr:hypothetical protein, conserved [Eimeria tenella]CDJ44832.1 hypothetical protein, conserved [Eimeria tenella]|eukprot:XP_013235580.1 hypothetical protein, conserved [Eimeria tenella]
MGAPPQPPQEAPGPGGLEGPQGPPIRGGPQGGPPTSAAAGRRPVGPHGGPPQGAPEGVPLQPQGSSAEAPRGPPDGTPSEVQGLLNGAPQVPGGGPKETPQNGGPQEAQGAPEELQGPAALVLGAPRGPPSTPCEGPPKRLRREPLEGPLNDLKETTPAVHPQGGPLVTEGGPPVAEGRPPSGTQGPFEGTEGGPGGAAGPPEGREGPPEGVEGPPEGTERAAEGQRGPLSSGFCLAPSQLAGALAFLEMGDYLRCLLVSNKSLKSLELDGFLLTPRGLQALKGAPLEALALAGIEAKDDTFLEALRDSCEGLKSFGFICYGGEKFTEGALKGLGRSLKNLKSVQVEARRPQVADVLAEAVAAAAPTTLTSLSVGGITEGCLLRLAQQVGSKLHTFCYTRLNVGGAPVNDSLLYLCAMRMGALTTLRLADALTPKDLQGAPGGPHLYLGLSGQLEALTLSRSCGLPFAVLSDIDFMALARSLSSKLQELELNGLHGISDAFLHEALDACGSGGPPAAPWGPPEKDLGGPPALLLRSFTNLTGLNLGACWGVNDMSVGEVLKGCTKLKTVVLNDAK